MFKKTLLITVLTMTQLCNSAYAQDYDMGTGTCPDLTGGQLVLSSQKNV